MREIETVVSGEQSAAKESTESRENVPLLPKRKRLWRARYRNTRKCVSSKAALLILLWSFIVILT